MDLDEAVARVEELARALHELENELRASTPATPDEAHERELIVGALLEARADLVSVLVTGSRSS